MSRLYRKAATGPHYFSSSRKTTTCWLAALGAVLALSACGAGGDADLAGGGPGATGSFLEICSSPSASDDQVYTVAELFASLQLDPRRSSCEEVIEAANESGKINLESTGIKDISPLAGFAKVENIDIAGNVITDLSPLADLPMLTSLNAGFNKLDRLPDLAKFRGLTALYLANNPITDLSGIEKLGQIETLEMSGTAVRDWSALTKLPKLQMLGLVSLQQPESLSTLPKMDYNALWLADNGIESYRFLAERAPKLERLYIQENALTSLEDSALFPNLLALNVSMNKITSVANSQIRPRFFELNLSSNPITDFRFLAAIDRVSILNLNNTGLSAVAPIAHLIGSAALVDISSTEITSVDFGSFTDWPILMYLDISDNAIASLNPLSRIDAPELKRFEAYDVEAVGKVGRCPLDAGPLPVQSFCRDGYSVRR